MLQRPSDRFYVPPGLPEPGPDTEQPQYRLIERNALLVRKPPNPLTVNCFIPAPAPRFLNSLRSASR